MHVVNACSHEDTSATLRQAVVSGEEIVKGALGQRGSLAHAEKNLGRGRFSKFSRSTKYA